MLLSTLFTDSLTNDAEGISFTHITDDSRAVQPGSVFVFDARIHPRAENFIQDAKTKGAIAVVSNIEAEGIIFHPLPGEVLARWAAQEFPKKPAHLMAVTGTNGKTSVAWFATQLLEMAGHKSASIGTLGVWAGGEKVLDTGYTSPTALQLHEILQNLAQQNITHVVLEASSHALALGRLEGLAFDAVGITNVTQDHLDFHETMEHYVLSKQRLFTTLMAPEAVGVVNMAASSGVLFASLCKQLEKESLTVGTGQAELVVIPQAETPAGIEVEVKYNAVQHHVILPLVGAFQAENVAVALGLLAGSGVDIAPLVPQLSKLKPVPGRMELIEKQNKNQPTVVVDYAHTPDALSRALEATRPLVKENGELWVVFGCGGDRDAQKRPIMGKMAAALADKQVITDDNPRTEDAAKIRAQILQGGAGEIEVEDRAQAIAHALQNATAGDVVLLAGKGHETGQVVGKETLPFDDREMARKVLANA